MKLQLGQEDMMSNNFVPVKGYEGLYEVSKEGIVRSILHNTTTRRIVKGKQQEFTWRVPGKIMKHSLRPDGYYEVSLTKQGVTTNVCLHRILAEAFIDNSDNKPEVNHKDGNKANNSLDNLEWATYTENNLHAVYFSLNVQAKKVYCFETDIIYPSMSEAERLLKLSQGSISTAIRKKRSVRGYNFKCI